MFTIGDFAGLSRVSVRMLRHYDAIGLPRPAHVDLTATVGDDGRQVRDERGRDPRHRPTPRRARALQPRPRRIRLRCPSLGLAKASPGSRVRSMARLSLALPIFDRCERPKTASVRACRLHPGRLAQGPEEKCGVAGRTPGFWLVIVYPSR